MTKLDFSKPDQLQTRDGSEFRIYATDHYGVYSVIGAVKIPSGWHFQSWDEHGHISSCNTKHPLDLIRKPHRIKGWINVYPLTNAWADRGECKKHAGIDCLGQIYIDAEVEE